MANKLYNIAGMSTATVGIANLVLGAALPGMITFNNAGVLNADVVSYSIRDGINTEVGQGTYTTVGALLSRDVVYNSTNGGAKIVLSGTASVYIAILASDIHQPVTLAVNNGLGLVGQVLAMGTPDTLTAATINAVTLTTHTHAITGFQPTLTTGNMTATSPIAVDNVRQVIGGAVVLSHEATAGNIHLPLAGVVNQILKNSGVAGTGAWGTVTENAGALASITTINMSNQLTNTLAIGLPPFVVTSTTLNTNLNADLLDGQHGAYYVPVTLAVNHGLSLVGQVLAMGTPDTLTAATINAVTLTTHTHAVTGFQPTLTTGNMTATSPIAVDNVRQVIGGAVVLSHEATAGNIHLPLAGVVNQILKNSGVAGTGSWGTVTESAGALASITTINMSNQLTNTLAIGLAPFVVTSTTVNANLNADLLDGQHAAYYGAAVDNVIIAPAASARNVIQPTGNFIPLTIKGNAAQVVNLQEWHNSIGTVLLAVDPSGFVFRGASRFIHNYFEAGSNGLNTFLGINAGNFTMSVGGGAVTLASRNTGIGEDTLTHLTTGYGNVAIGASALHNNTTGYANVGVGQNSLNSNVGGYDNVAIGVQAMQNNSTGYSNSALGGGALLRNVTGFMNMAIGKNALTFNTRGYGNVAIGETALYNNVPGYYNMAIGKQALEANTTGYQNVSIGTQSLFLIKPTSKAITAFSDYSGTVAGTVRATSVGHGLVGVTTKQIMGTVNYDGSYAVTVIDPDYFYFTKAWVATETGWWSIDAEGKYNVAIGDSAGRTLVTGSNNTFIGKSAGSDAAQLTSALNSMALGYLTYTTLSNTVVIGNTSVVGVGIGTFAPGAHLDLTGISDVIQLKVKGNAAQTANLQEWQKSTAAVQISFDDNGGAVFNEQGLAAGDHRIESDTEPNMVFLDASADTVSFGGTGAASSTVAKGGAITSPKTTTNDINFPASSPAALAGDVDNWDLGANTYIRATGGAGDRIITGIVARANGHLLIIQNIGATNKLSFSNESVASTAANRLINANAGTTEITPNHTIIFIYDATTARWREVTHL